MAAVARNLFIATACRNSFTFHHKIAHCRTTIVQVCGVKRWRRPVFLELHRRRLKQGPEPERHRSEWINWNYESELFSFGKRLGEDFQKETLSLAFTHRSYIEKEQERRKKLDMAGETDEPEVLDMRENSDLVKEGQQLTSMYVSVFLRHAFPALPEEGIRAVTNYLTTDEMLSFVGSNLGIKDLILCAEFPPSQETLSQTLKAVIGALACDQGLERAQLFVQDFLITQLVGKDILELWPLTNPMGVLESVLQAQEPQGTGQLESRLLYETGQATILAAYMVAVYHNKELVGKGYGETVTIAEEMAARDALRRIFNVTDSRAALPFGSNGQNLQLDLEKVNASLLDYAKPNQLQ